MTYTIWSRYDYDPDTKHSEFINRMKRFKEEQQEELERQKKLKEEEERKEAERIAQIQKEKELQESRHRDALRQRESYSNNLYNPMANFTRMSTRMFIVCGINEISVNNDEFSVKYLIRDGFGESVSRTIPMHFLSDSNRIISRDGIYILTYILGLLYQKLVLKTGGYINTYRNEVHNPEYTDMKLIDDIDRQGFVSAFLNVYTNDHFNSMVSLLCKRRNIQGGDLITIFNSMFGTRIGKKIFEGLRIEIDSEVKMSATERLSGLMLGPQSNVDALNRIENEIETVTKKSENLPKEDIVTRKEEPMVSISVNSRKIRR